MRQLCSQSLRIAGMNGTQLVDNGLECWICLFQRLLTSLVWTVLCNTTCGGCLLHGCTIVASSTLDIRWKAGVTPDVVTSGTTMLFRRFFGLRKGLEGSHVGAVVFVFLGRSYFLVLDMFTCSTKVLASAYSGHSRGLALLTRSLKALKVHSLVMGSHHDHFVR